MDTAPVVAENEPEGGQRARWWSISDPARAWANSIHSLGFFLAVLFGPPWPWIGLTILIVAIVAQLCIWGHPLEGSVGQIGGITLAMWLIHIAGYRDGAHPNIGLAILIVAVEVIVTLIATSLARWRRERLTPPGAEA
ncbi:hypothetical protein EON79_19500 [bacterium]|nr:MAG: hypothetical protein EON79_19500 [bacterium]